MYKNGLLLLFFIISVFSFNFKVMALAQDLDNIGTSHCGSSPLYHSYYGTLSSALPKGTNAFLYTYNYPGGVDGKYKVETNPITNVKTITYFYMGSISAWTDSSGVWQKQNYYNHLTKKTVLELFYPNRRGSEYPVNLTLADLNPILKNAVNVKYVTANIATLEDYKKIVTSPPQATVKTFTDYSVTSGIVKHNVLPENGNNIKRTSATTFELPLIIRANELSTNYNENFPTNKSDLADGLGMNVKVAGQACKVMGLVYYVPVKIVMTFEDACETDVAKAPTSSSNAYWNVTSQRTGSSRRPTYTTYFEPTQKTVDCACKTVAGGAFANPAFNAAISSPSGGYLNKPTTNQKVSCGTYNPGDKCKIASYNAGKLTKEETQICCDLGMPGFTGNVCPQNTTFHLYCPSKLTEPSPGKTYVSDIVETENLSHTNKYCPITCTEVANARIDRSPFVVAGQGFDYSFNFDTKLTCKTTYSKSSAVFATDFNNAVSARVSAYKAYLDAKAVYDAYNARCKSTWIQYHANSCCTGRRAYTTPAVYGSCTPKAPAKTCTKPLIKAAVYHPSTCRSNDRCTSTTWCHDPSITLSSYNSTLSSYRSTMNSRYSTYASLLTIENNLIRDKRECDSWVKAYKMNGDFELEIGETGISSRYNMRETSGTTTSTRITNQVSSSRNLYTNCSTTASYIGQCRTTSILVYDSWEKYAAYWFRYGYPDEMYIDKETSEATTTRPANYYYGGFNYFTSLGTLTGRDYELNILNSGKFGTYQQWDLKDGRTTCTYAVDNRLGPSQADSNHPKYSNLGLAFRTVALTDLFPNNRAPRSNWSNQTALINKIQDPQNNPYAKTPMYSIVLSPTTMKSIRNYNSETTYSDWSTFKFLTNNSGTSGFLEDLKKGIYGSAIVDKQ